MGALAVAPLLLILGVLVPPVTTLLVRLAELERKYCARYVGVPIEPAAPVTKRRFWQVHNCSATGSLRASARCRR